MDTSTPIVDIDPERRFGGVMRLYGGQALQRFKVAHVCIIGIGGVGSWAAESLTRSAVGALTLIDLDNVAESNVNRQVHALDGEFGRPKVAVMADRLAAINPALSLSLVEDFVTPENLDTMLDDRFDYVIDCMDQHRTKAALIAHCRAAGLKLVIAGGAGGRTDPTRIRVDDLARSRHDPLLARVRSSLRREYGFSRDLRKSFGVACVFSEETVVYPQADGSVCARKPTGAAASGLSCAGGLGSVMNVTASFGMAAAARALGDIADARNGEEDC
jgi:tRNA A37 threonylcarbamoyladenosine dehydratase